ncbi:chalcone isomerase family protein [Alteromonas sp. IB21]|uniref:chalcone isomerase family protein n=1 Tax=Alteromonas sp. IB21 TaxID=2779369 RepID=UPI0018E8E434|nr:chalcone isomerase family protein [Alteromonas sp. IB21]MBJ2128487.1 chalcone isomerase family protein [Alteromonas sp. IB21]
MSKVILSRVLSFLVMSCFSLSVFAVDESSYTHNDLTENTVMNNTDALSLSGTTIKKRFFFKVYRLSHFMEKPKGDFSTRDSLITFILNANTQQRIELEFLRDVTRNQIEEALMQGIEQNNANSDLSQIKQDIERLSSGFQDEVKKHSTLTLSRLSKEKLKVFFNNTLVVETESKALADALWSIWFGEDPIVDTEDLVQNILIH